jgi:hypothetical protein
MCKKYRALRALIVHLKTQYDRTRHYPIVPRYHLLKNMIKTVLRSSSFAEVCHELDE